MIRQFLYISLILLAFLYLYAKVIWHLLKQLATSGTYSYALLIPAICIYLIWDKRLELKRIKPVIFWPGILLICCALVLLILGELGADLFTTRVSACLMLVGIILFLYGKETVKILKFPLSCIFLMIPLPGLIFKKLSINLELISSKIAVIWLHLLNIPAYQVGNIINLGFFKLQIIEACSGLRYVFPLIVLVIIYSYLLQIKWWAKIILIILTIPIAIIANSFRIVTIAIIAKSLGIKASEGFLHVLSGWILFIITLFILMIIGFIFVKLSKNSCNDIKKIDAPNNKISKQVNDDNSKYNSQLFPVILVVILILISSFYLKYISCKKTVIPRLNFSSFPMKINDWLGFRRKLSPVVVKRLGLTDYLLADYINPQHKLITCYMVYYAKQRKAGKFIHNPINCFLATGWSINYLNKIPIFTHGKLGRVKVNCVLIKKNLKSEIVIYWYQSRGRIITNRYMAKLYLIYDAIVKNRTDGGLVRLSTPLSRMENISAAEKRLQEFAQLLEKVLGKYLPN